MPAYLEQRNKRRDHGSPLGSSGSRSGGFGKGGGKGPSGLHVVAGEAGMHVLTASGGWEADDVIGSMCSVMLSGTDPAGSEGFRTREALQLRPPCIVIASADSDMCALLSGGDGGGGSGGVAWLELLHRPEPSCPAGWRLQSAAQFGVAQGYPAGARPEFVALTGAA